MKKEKPKQQVQQVQVKEKKTSIKERLKSIKAIKIGYTQNGNPIS